jgi:hypothetical protein
MTENAGGPGAPPGDPASLAGLLAELTAREASHYDAHGQRIAGLAERISTVAGQAADITTVVAGHAAQMAGLEDIDERLAALAARLPETSPDSDDDGGPGASGGSKRSHRPRPSPPWFHLGRDPDLARQVIALASRPPPAHDGPAPAGDSQSLAERLAADLRALQEWVTVVLVPGYGTLARFLEPCWRQHPLCLYTLDWLCELWHVLYLKIPRSPGVLNDQAEFQIRLLPSAVDQVQAELRSCRTNHGHLIPPRADRSAQ